MGNEQIILNKLDMKFVERVFKNETVHLDFNEYIQCIFEHCNLVYSGSTVLVLSNCHFDNVMWSFSGNAANTLNFMQAMYHGADTGGRKLIEDTFEQIKLGKLQ